MRTSIYHLIMRVAHPQLANRIYNITVMLVACLSMVPLMVKQQTPWMVTLDLWTVYILFIDFVLHWMVADFSANKKGKWAFLRYPFTPIALLNFISLLPSLGLLPPSLRVLRLFRLVVVLRYSKNFLYISNVFKREKRTLLTVLMIAVGYIFISALVMFATEPDTFPDYFSAVYWATTALTTVGYGDIFPHSAIGRLVSMISSLFGIAIIALPAGVVTAGFMQQLEEDKQLAAQKPADPLPQSTQKEEELHV
ncbi:MAG: potassium channel family protein [Clostridia bacterium]